MYLYEPYNKFSKSHKKLGFYSNGAEPKISYSYKLQTTFLKPFNRVKKSSSIVCNLCAVSTEPMSESSSIEYIPTDIKRNGLNPSDLNVSAEKCTQCSICHVKSNQDLCSICLDQNSSCKFSRSENALNSGYCSNSSSFCYSTKDEKIMTTPVRIDAEVTAKKTWFGSPPISDDAYFMSKIFSSCPSLCKLSPYACLALEDKYGEVKNKITCSKKKKTNTRNTCSKKKKKAYISRNECSSQNVKVVPKTYQGIYHPRVKIGTTSLDTSSHQKEPACKLIKNKEEISITCTDKQEQCTLDNGYWKRCDACCNACDLCCYVCGSNIVKHHTNFIPQN